MLDLTNIQDYHELNRSNEFSFIEDQLRLRREQVNAAVEVVGNDYQKIQEFLKARYVA